MASAPTKGNASVSTSDKAPKAGNSAPKVVESLDISKSNETLDLAKDLAKFIKDNKLSTQVQGKEFVNVEGWQYAGSRLGIVPVVEHVINLSSDQELKYQAKVTLFDLRHGVTVGAGFAICSNKESGKKFYQEFAIASMAQTRAIGKAYRNILAWIIRAAGYEPTPAEEMEYSGNVPTPAPEAKNADAATLLVMVAASNSAAPVASTGSDQSKVSAERVAQLTQQFEAATSGIDVKKIWDKLTKNEATALLGAKEAAKARLRKASDDAAQRATRGLRTVGDGTKLVDEFDVVEPAEGQAMQYATASQKEEIIRLTNHPLITRQEKTKMLLGINRLEEALATKAIAKLRKAIEDREGYQEPTDAEQLGTVRAAIGLLLKETAGKLEIDDEGKLRAALSNQHATLEELQVALRVGQEAAWDAETDGTEHELDAATSIAA